MPIYEYECQQCGERFEYFRRFFEDEKEIKCPRCGAEKSRKVVSAFTRGSSSGGACLPRESG